jgi:Zn-dependent protease
MRGGSVTLFHLRGIRIAADYSWFLVLFLFIFWLSGFYGDILGTENGDSRAYLLAVASSLLFFVSILLHELGHAFVAMRNGIGISGINLWMFGGMAHMERESDTAGQEFRIAAAGPLVTFVIAVTLAAVGLAAAGPSAFGDAMRFEGDADTSGVLAMVAWLSSINMLVLIFNLIPAYPMDGGRIARAIAWWRTGDRNRATRFAAILGRGFSYVFIAFGLYLLLAGDPITGIWLAMIGFMIGQAARAAQLQSAMTSKFEGISVADVMDREPVAIPDGLSAEEALDQYFLRYGWPWFPVVDAAQRFRGLLDRKTVDELPEASRVGATVGEILQPDVDRKLFVRDDAPVDALLTNETLRDRGALMAVDAGGRLSGVVTIEQLSRALQGAIGGAAGPA